MKKVVIDARESGTSTGRYVDKLIEHLAYLKPAYDITILTKPERMSFIQKIAPNFKVIETPYKEFTFAEQIGLLKQIKSLKPDLVHFTMVQQPVLYRGKVVTTMQDLTTVRFRNPSKNAIVFTIKQIVYKWVNKKVAKESVNLITPTEFVKKDVVDYTHVSPDKIMVTYEAADKITDAPEPVSGLENQQFIMYIGRPMPHKNLGRLVEAFKILKQKYPALKLVLAGKKDGLYERIERAVKEDELKDVLFTGFVTEGQLRWLYEHTAAYIFPSLSEGFGLPGLEALVTGAPVVSSNATCLPEVYGDSVLYFDPLNTQDMADKIARVLSDVNLVADLRQKGLKQVQKYSWQRMAEQTLEVYKNTLSE